MLFGFYQLTCACKKYQFSFVIESEQQGRVEITIRPLDVKCRRTIIANGYSEAFKKAIDIMKKYRERW